MMEEHVNNVSTTGDDVNTTGVTETLGWLANVPEYIQGANKIAHEIENALNVSLKTTLKLETLQERDEIHGFLNFSPIGESGALVFDSCCDDIGVSSVGDSCLLADCVVRVFQRWFQRYDRFATGRAVLNSVLTFTVTKNRYRGLGCAESNSEHTKLRRGISFSYSASR